MADTRSVLQQQASALQDDLTTRRMRQDALGRDTTPDTLLHVLHDQHVLLHRYHTLTHAYHAAFQEDQALLEEYRALLHAYNDLLHAQAMTLQELTRAHSRA